MAAIDSALLSSDLGISLNGSASGLSWPLARVSVQSGERPTERRSYSRDIVVCATA
jgi:hypothetical protein